MENIYMYALTIISVIAASISWYSYNKAVKNKKFFVTKYFNKDLIEEQNQIKDYTQQYHIKKNSIKTAVNIYQSFTKEEATKIHPSILSAWRIGRRCSKIENIAPSKFYNKGK